MRSKVIFVIALVLVAVFLLQVYDLQAGTKKRKGTAGAQELLIPVGSIGTALAGAVVANTAGVEAIYWNPAGLAVTEHSAETLISHMEYFAGIDLNYAAVAANFGRVGFIALSLKSLDFGEIPETTEYAPDGTGETFSPTFITLGLTYSKAMTDRIFFGTNIKLVSESIMRESVTGLAFDIGLQYITGIAGIRLGVALKNFGPNMRFDGPDLEETVNIPGQRPGSRARPLRIPLASFELPTTLEMGISYSWTVAENQQLCFSGSFLNDNFGFDRYAGGVQYSFNDIVYFRGGWTVGYDADEGKFRYQKEDFLFGPSFGGGLKVALSGNIAMRVDYAYRTAQYLDDNQWFSLTVGF